MTAGLVSERRAWVEQVMGLPVSVHVRGVGVRNRPDVLGAVQALYAELRRADATFSTYRTTSELSRFRRGQTAAGADLREVLELCELARQHTGGLFDAAPAGRPLDPSGLVKGWAVHRAAGQLARLPDLGWAVGAGGDVVVDCGAGEPWRVGVEDPADRSRMLTILHVHRGAVATSGTAARGNHVLDPRTGKPATALAAATVVGPSLLWADVLATAAFVGATTELPVGLPGYCALLVERDGSVRTGPQWPGPSAVTARRLTATPDAGPGGR